MHPRADHRAGIETAGRDPVDVVVITWNDDPSMVRAAVGSALAQDGVEVRVLLVDNGSDDPVPSGGVVADPRVRLIRSEHNLGVAGGRNLGARAGSSPWVCFLDSDARLHPDTLARLIDAVGGSDVGLVAPVFTDQLPEASAGRAPDLRVKVARGLNRRDTYETTREAGQRVWEVDFAIGACQLVRRDAYAEVGGLDESYFYGPEDVDFCLRLGQAGWRCLQVGDAACDHPPRRRYRRVLDRQGLRHAWAILRHLRRHRHRPVPRPGAVPSARGSGT